MNPYTTPEQEEHILKMQDREGSQLIYIAKAKISSQMHKDCMYACLENLLYDGAQMCFAARLLP